jgi:DNA-binding CsgD family transcriptional regulator
VPEQVLLSNRGTALSPRELEVLRLIAAGHTSQEIARALATSVTTIERHITHLYEKMGVRGRAEATAYALRHGLA